MTANWRRLRRDRNGAVAPTVALSLVALIAVGGIAFDYARFATMDSELQNAADQAALAAASQLDGQPGACARAAQAARELVQNRSLVSNVGGNVEVVVATEDACDADGTVRFFQDKEKIDPADDDTNAKFVEVEVDPRTVFYALTPIVGLLYGEGAAIAFAGMNEAICKVPPLMVCNPLELDGNTNPNLQFDAGTYLGYGFRAVANESYEPGAFGFLETEAGAGANVLLAALGWNFPPGNCSPVTGVEVKSGVNASVLDGLNTRFDVPGAGLNCPAGGTCAPSVNVVKDLVRPANSCNWDENDANSGNFDTRRYRPTSASLYASTKNPIMGHPRDLCHAWSNAGDCNGIAGSRMGTGDWDINAYWRSNHGADYAAEVSVTDYGPQPKGYPTRYQVYRWEADNLASISTPVPGAGATQSYRTPQSGRCLADTTSPYGIVPGDESPDRRRISAAVLNCKALAAEYGNLNGQGSLPVATWIDMFLVEPSITRTKCKGGSGGCNTKYTEKFDVYVEFIGKTLVGGNAEEVQLVKKSVPYLIE